MCLLPKGGTHTPTSTCTITHTPPSLPHLCDVPAPKGRHVVDDGEVALALKAHVGLVLLDSHVQVHGEATPTIPASVGSV